MLIRTARPDEYDQVGALTAGGYAADGLLTRPDGSEDHYEPVLRDAAGRAPQAELMVCVADPDQNSGAEAGPDDATSVLFGTVTWCPPGSTLRELADGDRQGEIRMLSVSPDHRRLGVGRLLTQWCLDRARAEGLEQVWLCSLDQMTKAHALYRSLGFVRVPERDWRPVPAVDLWAFRLDL